MPKDTGRKLIAQNKKARHDYHIGETYEAGLVLTGTEVKTLRLGRASLAEAYASIDSLTVSLDELAIDDLRPGTPHLLHVAGRRFDVRTPPLAEVTRACPSQPPETGRRRASMPISPSSTHGRPGSRSGR